MEKPQPQKPKKSSNNKKKVIAGNPVVISSLDTWREYVTKNWQSLKKQAESPLVKTPYQQLIVIAFTPIMPANATKLKSMLKIIEKLRYTEALVTHIKTLYTDKNYKRTAIDLAIKGLDLKTCQTKEQIGLDWLLMATGSLSGLTQNSKSAKDFTQTLLDAVKSTRQAPSAVRVQAGMISAGQNVIFAGQDVNIIQQHYQGDKAKLKSYLAKLRTDWIIPATTIHPTSQRTTTANLHQLYTPVDIWIDGSTSDPATNTHQLNEKRFQNIDKDRTDARISVLEKIATNPLVVVTGGAGSGKSTLSQFIVTALAYACDPAAEKREKIDGLELLGPSWIHGPILPLYVSLRDFCNTNLFPKTMQAGTADSLLKYIKTNLGDFAPFLESYLTLTDVPTQGTLLVLDGVDEVYKDTDRMILQRIIETWAQRFPSCRIIVTSRTYAYRQGARWRLSERFVSAELAPYTWQQMASYIENWYEHLATTQSRTWSGRPITLEQAKGMAEDLKKTIQTNHTVLPLARQPMMLVLLTSIHESQKRLPTMRAKLYEETVELLDRWNIPLPTDQLHEQLENMDLERMRAALKMIAFDLQSQQKHYHRYPTTINRGDLLDKLLGQQAYGNGLGAPIEAVLNYLATRNGILVSDTLNQFRFAHLSIQEYLAACSLIEFYDECKMPSDTLPPSSDGWTFPDNIVALLHHDHSRWHNVALFVGSILASNTGQDMMRWHLIEKLLPENITKDMPETTQNCIGVAAKIWSESWLKVRVSSQRSIKDHLTACLVAIEGDERVDAPDRARNRKILTRLQTDNVETASTNPIALKA